MMRRAEMPLPSQIGEDFFGAGGMSGTLAIHSVENVGHTSEQYTAGVERKDPLGPANFSQWPPRPGWIASFDLKWVSAWKC